MPQIAQQDYKVIAPKPGRAFDADAAALGEIKKAILNGIGFDCLIKDAVEDEGDINRVLGFYLDGSYMDYWSTSSNKALQVGMFYTVTQYQGLAAVQNAVDEASGELMGIIPDLTKDGGHLNVDDPVFAICVNGKYLTSTAIGGILTALAIAETGPSEDDDYINITWEDAQKLIGLPIN